MSGKVSILTSEAASPKAELAEARVSWLAAASALANGPLSTNPEFRQAYSEVADNIGAARLFLDQRSTIAGAAARDIGLSQEGRR